MGMFLRNRSFKRSLLFSVGGLFVLFALCFTIYQYRREKEFKIDILHSRLQMYNYSLVHSLGEEELLNDSIFRDFVSTNDMQGLRVSVIDLDGRVLMDSRERNAVRMENHLHRREVYDAIRNGEGYDIKRTSESTRETYFYSATRFGNLIIRSAVPYSAELTQSLQADYTFFVFAAVMVLLLGVVLYYNATRITRHISYLRDFAVKAERGENLDHEQDKSMPDDELGDISRTIITMYLKLKRSEEDKMRIKRQLTENAAHELKTPAASIHGYLESILDNPDMDGEQRNHFLERCYAQSERMNSLLRDMSVLTHLDEIKEKGRMINESVVVARVVESVLEDTSQQLDEKGITSFLDIDDSVVVRGDSGLIYGIFRNLVDNAIAYATGATRIEISASRGELGYFQFTFSDNGIGVEPQHLAHLFERFYRVDKGRSRKMGGTGLGLAIVRNSVIAHGGTILAEPHTGGGLEIRFTLKM